MKRSLSIAALVAVLAGLTFGAGVVHAHDDAYLDTQKAPHGGQMRMAGAYHFELVVTRDSAQVKENPVLVYVTDHAGKEVPTAGARGKVMLLAGKLRAEVTLQPDGENRLKGFAKYASVPDMKAVVSVTLAGQAAGQARFTPLAGAQAAHAAHSH